jgi:hypothetical protein
MFELHEWEAKTLYDHLITVQEGCFFIGEIVDIIEKLEAYLNIKEVK